jgi:hypothetical protein
MSAHRLRNYAFVLAFLLLAACGGGGGGYGGGGGGPQNQSISFATPGPVSGQVGDTVTNVASGGAGTGAITCASSNTSVATVNATSGVATLLTAGTTTITATKAASSGYNAASASYTLNVSLVPQTIAFARPVWRRETESAAFAPRSAPILTTHGSELWLVGGFGATFMNDVWRSSDGIDWRVGFSETITIP